MIIKNIKYINGYYQYFLVLIIILFTFNATAAIDSEKYRKESDSIKSLLNQCNVDTCKFYILQKLVWRYWDNDISMAKYYAGRAYTEIKNSHNLKALSDGYDIKGNVLKLEGNYDSAYYIFDKALTASKTIGYKSRIAWSYYNLADLSYSMGDPKTALDDMKNAEKYFSNINYNKQISASTFFIADMYERLGEFDSALVYYNHKLKLDKKNSDKVGETLTYLNLSDFYKKQNNNEKSLEYLNYAFRQAEVLNNNKALINVYLAIGDFFFEQKKNYPIALNYYNKALEMTDKKYNKGLITILYNQIGNIYLEEGKDSIALFYNLKSLDIAKELNYLHPISDANKSLGFTYKKLRNYQSALNCFKTCYHTGCNKCPIIVFHEALIEIADIYVKLNDFGQAFTWYQKSLELAEKYHSKKEISLSKFKIGNYYHKLNQFQPAEKYYLQSIKLAEEAKSIALIKSIADTLSKFYIKRNSYNTAYSYLHLSQIMGDSLSKMDRQTNMAELEMKFEFEKIKKENEAKQALSAEEIKRQKIYRNSLMIISGLLSLLGIVVYISYQRKKKNNLQLTVQKNEIMEKNQEIQMQIEEIERISEKLHEADQKKLSFFTNISHEFRTPLTLIFGPIEKLIKEHSNHQGTYSLLNIVQRNTYQLYNLINQLLDIRKIDTGNVRLKIHKDDIVACAKEIFTTFYHLAEENKITYTFHAKEENMIGWFDRYILEKTMNNLLSNAFKYTPKGGKIKVELSQISLGNISEHEISQIKITIRDNGKGIPEDQVKYVFDRYYQVENRNSGFNTGTGIGLAYTKELIELHKGNIHVESKINQGTTFTIILPVHGSYYNENEISTNHLLVKETDIDDISLNYLRQLINQENQDIPKNSRNKKSECEQVMLIIEDNTDLRTFIKGIFVDDYSIYEAENGLRGYQLAIALIPDIVISDIMMPEMDGLELCNKLKSHINTNHIPILLLTAKTGIEYEIDGLNTGADDYLTKPFNSSILEARINGLIESRKKLREHFRREILLNPKEVKYTSLEDKFLKKAVKVIEDNITNPDLDVELLMKELCVSRAQLFRKLKAITNYSANQFIRNIKLKRAAQLLGQNSFNLSEVLYQSGFTNRSYFSACFKEMFGCLPKDYAYKATDTSNTFI